ncbi:hypothetical protein [uncultured Marinobacter sp.]|jgi:hypothetical protein|uniref:hypothetical protein n=1 Tax=uncultured Marinobacter sp. TaxID=187379 RepID=UPI002599C4B8|nr:hypothetical protein [uncultured Marinobacter sp.]
MLATVGNLLDGESFVFVVFFDSDSRGNVISLADRVAKAFAEDVDLLFFGIEIETSVLGVIFELDELLDDQFDVFNVDGTEKRLSLALRVVHDLHIASPGQLAYGIFLVEIVQELYILSIYIPVERVPYPSKYSNKATGMGTPWSDSLEMIYV